MDVNITYGGFALGGRKEINLKMCFFFFSQVTKSVVLEMCEKKGKKIMHETKWCGCSV